MTLAGPAAASFSSASPVPVLVLVGVSNFARFNFCTASSMWGVYPDASHGFNADYRDSYRKEPATDGWQRMTKWFKSHGVV